MSDRPRLLVDVDFVLYDWLGAMRTALEQYAGIPMKQTEVPPTEWAVWNQWRIPEGLFRKCWRRGIADGWLYNHSAPDPQAIEALWTLSDAEYDIQVVTARLNQFDLHHETITQTIDWFDTYGIPYRGISFTGSKTIDAFAAIDDSPRHLSETNVEHKLLWVAEHNEHKRDGFIPVHGWADTLFYLSEVAHG